MGKDETLVLIERSLNVLFIRKKRPNLLQKYGHE